MTSTWEQVASGEVPLPTEGELSAFYEEAKRRAKAEPEFAAAVQSAVVIMQGMELGGGANAQASDTSGE